MVITTVVRNLPATLKNKRLTEEEILWRTVTLQSNRLICGLAVFPQALKVHNTISHK